MFWQLQRQNQEYDKEGLEITGELLSANPDFNTLWNYRKEILTHMKQDRSEFSTLVNAKDLCATLHLRGGRVVFSPVYIHRSDSIRWVVCATQTVSTSLRVPTASK